MSLKQSIEGNPFIYLATVATGAFIAGWGAHVVVQTTAGLVPVPADKAKLTDAFVQERESLHARITSLQTERDSAARQLASLRATSASAATASPPTGTSASAATGAQRPSAQPPGQPSFPMTVGNVYLKPNLEDGVTVNDDIAVEFDYVIQPGRAVKVWLIPQGRIDGYIGEDTDPIIGSGRLRRVISVPKEATISALEIWAQHAEEKAVRLKRVAVTIPVRKLGK